MLSVQSDTITAAVTQRGLEQLWVWRLWQEDNIKVTAVNHVCCPGVKSNLCPMNCARVRACTAITTQGS